MHHSTRSLTFSIALALIAACSLPEDPAAQGKLDEPDAAVPGDEGEAVEAVVARGVINANPHPVRRGSTCAFPDYHALATSPFTALNAYHVSPDNCSFTTAMSTAFTKDKPRIISDDAPHQNAHAQQWIGQVCTRARANVGEFHFEHFERSLDRKGKRAGVIAGFDTFPTQGQADCAGDPICAQEMLTWLATGDHSCATPLAPNGQLSRSAGSPRKLRWNGAPVTLLGFGSYGAITAGDARLASVPYLDALAAHRVNMTRVWAVEQWTGRAVDTSPPRYDGVAPYDGGDAPGVPYHLERPSARFLARLRAFVQAAADRGVVVQLTLFDKHGIDGLWALSPHNAANNVNGFIVLGTNPLPPAAFTTLAALQVLHDAYIRWVVEEVGGVGNVMFEIMNEAMDDEWNNIQTWQQCRARKIHLALPTVTVRDAFTGDPDGTSLALKAADRGGTWSANNAHVEQGRVVADGTAGTMWGVLPLSSAGQERLSVRADLERARGDLMIGLVAAGAGRELVARLVPPPSTGADDAVETTAPRRSTLQLVLDGVVLAQTEVSALVGRGLSLRLTADLAAGTASVSVDSSAVPALTAVPVPSMPAFSHTFFRGVDPGGYTRDHGWIDNVEASGYCSSGACIGNVGCSGT